MLHITLPAEEHFPLPFYLALEEVLANHFSEECLFTWVVRPTVIFGRNQVMANEVNVPFCKANAIEMVRRKSGGGCVYADEGNIMISYVTPTDGHSVEDIFARYLQRVVDALNAILPPLPDGCQIRATGRNDIMLGERKISGNALYTTNAKRSAIVHGTLLHSTDIERMVNAITPSTEKLMSKGVQSVRQRVVNLTEFVDISIPRLRRKLAGRLCDKELPLSPALTEETKALMQEYLAPEWLNGKFGSSSEAAFPMNSSGG